MLSSGKPHKNIVVHAMVSFSCERLWPHRRQEWRYAGCIITSEYQLLLSELKMTAYSTVSR